MGGVMTEKTLFEGTSSLLSSDAKRQLKKSYKAGIGNRNGLWELYLKPNLLDRGNGTHTPIVPVDDYRGRREEHADTLIASNASDAYIQAKSPYFMNPLRIPNQSSEYGHYDDGSPKWEPPSKRFTNVGFLVFTIEIDNEDLAFLEQQLSWCRDSTGKGRPKNSPIGKVDKELSRYIDYRGVTAVYSGSKSIHFHFVFDTKHLSTSLSESDRRILDKWQGDVPDSQLADLYRIKWLEVVSIFRRVIGYQGDVDETQKSPYQLRRTPWGHRVIDGKHLLGLPPGTIVPQCVLLDLIKERSPNGAKKWFLHPSQCTEIDSASATRKTRRSARPVGKKQAKGLLLKLQKHCREHWGQDYPQPVELVDDGGENVVYFKNNANDKHPSTVIRGEYCQLLLCGQHQFKQIFLPDDLSLDGTLNLLRGGKTDSGTLKRIPRREHFNNWLERVFANHAGNKDKARDALSALSALSSILTERQPYSLIKSVEGIGKTYSLMRDVPRQRYDDWIEHDKTLETMGGNTGEEPEDWYEPGFLALAFRSYEQAEAKCLEFNKIHGDEGLFVGKVLKSVSRVYQDTCKELGKIHLTMETAAGQGYDSFMQAVTEHDPEVYKSMCQKRDEFWSHPQGTKKNKVDPLGTIFFTVHSVVQTWGYNGPSRGWHHPDYEQCRDDPKEVSQLGKELKISKLIYDEVTYQDLVNIVSKADIDKCKKLEKKVKDWDKAKLPEKYAAYRSVFTGNEQGDITYSKCNSYINERFGEDDLQEVEVSAAPFGKDHDEKGLYRGQQGTKYYLKAKRWWEVLGAHMVVLTTEDLPAKLLRNLSWSEKDKSGKTKDRSFKVYEFDDISGFLREAIPVVLDKRAGKDRPANGGNQPVKRVTAIVDEIHAYDSDIHFIGDNLKEMNLPCTHTHEKAKGSNELAGSDIVTLIQYLSPRVYAELCLLAATYGIKDIVRIYYRDMLFQAIGRNRGFRRSRDKDTDHHVVMNPRLYKELGKAEFTVGRRYELVLRKPFWK
jgi:hypothetical protein